ncbi:hypothetical protein [Bradyrhizobium glycinis]|uniref:hypothetical protein n=1 Tax=Bradyrhizobium glycinis TaxID=2751812 RepID=UPI001FE408E8|nr:hypothetical protein [Bradyrhizobium glycinis]
MPLRVDCPSRRNCSRVPTEIQYIAIEQPQSPLRQDHLVASDGRQPVHIDAAGLAAVVGRRLERQDLAAIGARRLHGVFELSEATLHHGRPRASGGHHDFDPDAGLATRFAIGAEQDRISQTVQLAKPQTVVEASGRTALANITSEYCSGAIATAARSSLSRRANESVS